VKALVLLSAWCGVRWGEVIELRRKDIGKGAAVVMVSRAASHRGKGCRVDMPKSGKARAVVVPPHIREDLKEHLARYVDKEPDPLVFPALRYGVTSTTLCSPSTSRRPLAAMMFGFMTSVTSRAPRRHASAASPR